MNETQSMDVAAANARWDREHPNWTPIRTAWSESRMLRRSKLTDKQIRKYEEQGWYSVEFKEARRERMLKQSKSRKREGNFDVAEGGRLIYRP